MLPTHLTRSLHALILPLLLHAQSADGLLEGPTADVCEKGGRPMSFSPFSSIREEVQDYLNSCEHLLAAVTLPTAPRFSKQELELLEYYASEIAEKILLHQVQNK